VELAAKTTREEDVALARRAATGDRAAQRELFHAHKLAVHHTLFRVLGSNREIEDVLQDAFVEIFRALPSFRGDSSLVTWCRTIAMRTAYLVISRRKPATIDLALVEDVVEHDAPGADRVAHARQAARRLYAALDRIEPKQRVAFALFAIDGLTIDEVAELTESTRVAVKTRIWRARRDLRKRAARDPVLRDYLKELEGDGR
jgi:RNA polymerase sigma-70 factor (ECF subfamily)